MNKVRTRLGVGFRSSRKTRFEFLYIRDSNRSAPGAPTGETVQAFDLRLKMRF